MLQRPLLFLILLLAIIALLSAISAKLHRQVALCISLEPLLQLWISSIGNCALLYRQVSLSCILIGAYIDRFCSTLSAGCPIMQLLLFLLLNLIALGIEETERFHLLEAVVQTRHE